MNDNEKVKNDSFADDKLKNAASLIVFALVFIAALFWTLYSGKMFGILSYLVNLIFPVFIVALVIITGAALGQYLIMPFNSVFKKYRFRLYIGTLLGIGAISHAMLFLGLARLYDKRIIFVVFSLLVIVLLKKIMRIAGELYYFGGRLASRGFSAKETLTLILISVMLLLYLINAFAPSANYDVLEYHLGALRHFAETKDISPVPNNFYSAQPYHIEMLYLLGSFLEGYIGGYTPKIFVFFILLLNCIGLILLAETLGLSLAWRLFGVLLYLANYTIFRLGFDAFNDLGVCLYLTALSISYFHFVKSGDKKSIALAGVFGGLMLSCKYTVFGMYIFPMFAILLPMTFIATRLTEQSGENIPTGKYRFSEIVKIYLLAGALCLLVYSPWLLKGWIECKNPTYPFFNSIFRTPSWTPEQAEFLFRSHGKLAAFSTGHFLNCIRRINGLGAIYIIPLFFVLLLKRRSAGLFSSAIFIFASYFIWNLVSNAPDRFLAPALPLAITLQISLLSDFIHKVKSAQLILAGYVAFILAANASYISASLAIGLPQAALGIMTEKEFIAKNINEEFAETVDFVNTQIPEQSKVLLIYEARQYLFNKPVLFNTVFDQSPILNAAKKTRDAEEIIVFFKNAGYTHALVNELELTRFINFYTPPEEQKKRGIEWIIANSPLERIRFLEYYGPYQFDKEYSANKDKIDDFMTKIYQKKIFEQKHPSGLKVYVARL